MVRKLGVGSIRFVVALLLVAVAGALSFGAAGTARAQDGASVDIVDFAFQPSSITIEAGATVTWTNSGNAPHTVTADDGTFDSGNIDSGGTYSFTFDTPGTYTYHCNIHPQMTAEIVVTEASSGDTTGDNSGNETGNTTDSGTDTTLPTTGAGTTASHGASVAALVFALALFFAASGVMATRRRSAR